MNKTEFTKINKIIQNHLKAKGFTEEDLIAIKRNKCKLPNKKLNLIVKS